MKVTLVSYTPEPEKAIVEAASTCWKSTPREEILHHIIKAGHWTPLEFATFNFKIEGVSRALTHQLVRKRVGVAFAQESQRYVKYEDGFDYVTPDSIGSNYAFDSDGFSPNDIYEGIMNYISVCYKRLLKLGIPPEDARFILPNACTSTISMSINYHALIDLAKERLCTRAQWEIRRLVDEIRKKVAEVSPELAEHMRPKCVHLGMCPEKKPCGMVRLYE